MPFTQQNKKSEKKAIVIGSGFAGLSAACFLAKSGFRVTVLEKNEGPGGRARKFEAEGFSFDMGPSWYWMPDVFERFFQQFGKKVSDYYELSRLDPSYRVYWQEGFDDIPADLSALKALFERYEPGAAGRLDQFLKEAAYKYEVGMKKLVYQPSLSVGEYMDAGLMKGILQMDVFQSMKKHIRKYFSHPHLCQLLEFPILFLGALPRNTPALYSLMNYADIVGGTWFPKGGMYEIVKAMHQLAEELGVRFHFNEEGSGFQFDKDRITTVKTNKDNYSGDVVISTADYHFTETRLLPEAKRQYSEKYWNKRAMAPSSLLFYVGVNRKLEDIPHHSLFFDVDFEQHAAEIYSDPVWPSDPLFYLCVTSSTDPTMAPEGCENLFFLIPLAAGIDGDTEALRERYFERLLERLKQHSGVDLKDHILFKRSYCLKDFQEDYHAFKGNAYGLANTLTQTAFLKPRCKSTKVSNLYYAGQLTVPGPGVPPSLISGELVADLIKKKYNAHVD